MCKRILLFLTVVSLGFGQILAPGDIAVVGYQTTNPDSIALMPTVDIPAGTIVTLTDQGWRSSNSFRTGTNESELIITFVTGYSAGTVFKSPASSSSDINVSFTGSLNLADGDQLILFQVIGVDTTFIYGLNSRVGSWDADATSPTTSALPRGLVNGYTAVSLPGSYNNSRYDESVSSGTKNQLLAAISNEANWDAHRSHTTPWNNLENLSDMTVSIPTYNLSHSAQSTGDVSAGGLLYMGYFQPDYTTNWVDSVTVSNRVSSGTVNELDIDSVHIFHNSSTGSPIGNTPDTIVAWQNDGSGGFAEIMFDSARYIDGNYFHIAYRLSAGRDPSRSVGLQIDTIYHQDPATPTFEYPFQFSSDITLPVQLAPMSYQDRGKRGLDVIVKTYSEASPSVLSVYREGGDEERTLLAEFTTNGSVSHGKEYVLTDNSAAYGEEYTYRLYEDGVLTDKSLTLTRVPTSIEIGNNFPNPFNPTTRVNVLLPERSHIELAVFNVLGQKVFGTSLRDVAAGQKELSWRGITQSGQKAATGVYFMRVHIQSGTRSKHRVQKVVLLK